MKSREVVGRKIVSIRQARFWNANTNEFEYEFCSIRLDNGSVIVLHAIETPDCPAVTASLVKPQT